MILHHYGKRVVSYLLQSVILQMPEACSNQLGIYNKEISFVLDYEGHLKIDQIQTNGFEIFCHLSTISAMLLFSLCVYWMDGSLIMNNT